MGTIRFIYIAAGAMMLACCTQEELISISKQEVTQNEPVDRFDNGQYQTAYRPTSYEIIVITAKTKAIMVKAVSVNKGNCPAYPFAALPVALKFGETLTARVACDPIEVAAETDQGAITVSW